MGKIVLKNCFNVCQFSMEEGKIKQYQKSCFLMKEMEKKDSKKIWVDLKKMYLFV